MLRTITGPVIIGLCLWVGAFFCSGQVDETPAQRTEVIFSHPTQIIIGSMVFGAKIDLIFDRRIKISGLGLGESVTQVDLSRASGVSVLNQRNSSEGEDIDLAIDSDQFCKNEPYGKFIKKLIRIGTTSPTEPQLIVPVIGWLDINKTPRDFNRYMFKGALRWQGPWATPNMAGAVIVPLLLLLLGAWTWVATQWYRGFRWINIMVLTVLTINAVAFLTLLGLTYSRGAWAAFLSGCAILIYSATLLRRTAAIALLAFILILLFLPSGMQRMTASSHLEDDLSIANRLKLWTGALQMMAEHPWLGVGSGQFGEAFEKDYQTYSHTAHNSTAVSDFLTLGAEHGLLLLGIVLGFLLFVVAVSFESAFRSKSILQITLTASLVAILISSTFSTLWFVHEYQILFLFVFLALLGLLAAPSFRRHQRIFEAGLFLAQASKTILFTLLILGLFSLTSLCLLPTRLETRNSTVQGFHNFEVIEPRWAKPLGIILYLSNTEDMGLLPRGWDYSVEIRNESLLHPRYFEALRHHNVAHTFNNWTRMPSVAEQMRIPESFTADFASARFLLKPGRSYEQAVATFSPYRELKEPNPEARQALANLLTVRDPHSKTRRRYLYVNNRLEGCSLWTIYAVLNRLIRQPGLVSDTLHPKL
jgi:hypothetical protein